MRKFFFKHHLNNYKYEYYMQSRQTREKYATGPFAKSGEAIFDLLIDKTELQIHT